MEGIYANQVQPIDGGEINENAHFKKSGEFRQVPAIQTPEKSVKNRQRRDTKEVLNHFSWLYEGH